MLLALLSGQRCQTLHCLSVSSMKVSDSKCVFTVDVLLKQSLVSVTSTATFAISTQMQWTSSSAKNESLWEDSAFTAVPKQMQLILVFVCAAFKYDCFRSAVPRWPCAVSRAVKSTHFLSLSLWIFKTVQIWSLKKMISCGFSGLCRSETWRR